MKTIVLIDFSLQGHHLSFVRSFAKILLEQGHKVICIVPEPESVKSWLVKEINNKVWNFLGYNYQYKPVESKMWGRFNDTVKVLHRWKYEGQLIEKIEKETGTKVDFVFYAWLDNQFAQYIPQVALNKIFPFKWSGLYFHPYHLRLNETFLNRPVNWRDFDGALLSKNCIGVAVHDLGIVKKFTKRINKPVLHFPETADDTPPDYQNELYRNIKEKAAGRIVVGMIGCEPHKGTLNMMRVVKKADPNKYFFCFIGNFQIDGFSGSEKVEVQRFINEKRENCFFHFHIIPEGTFYNSVFCAFDIPFLVYNNFISSSNRLTKAAIFNRLVLASNNYCVGEDVKKFNLGEAVEPDNPEAALHALESLATKIKNKNYPRIEWEQYRLLNSNEELAKRFFDLCSILTKSNFQ